MHYIAEALENTAWRYKCQGKHSLTSDLCCASVQCPSKSPHIISSFVILPMPLPVITNCTVITLWSTITHITYLYTHTICLMSLLILKCVPNNEGSQILQNVGNYLLSDKAPRPHRPIFVYRVVFTLITI